MIRCRTAFRFNHLILIRQISKVHFDRLGLQQNASKKDIKSAYFSQAKQCHPDLFPDNPDKTEQYLQLQESYNALMATTAEEQEAANSSVKYSKNFAKDIDWEFLKSVKRQPLSRETMGEHVTSTISSDDLADGIERSLNVAVCLVFLVLGGVVAVETVRWLHRSATELTENERKQIETHEHYKKLNEARAK